MNQHVRKLVTLRKIDDLRPIPGADAIEVAAIEGWDVVVKKGQFKIGDPCVYFEIDSFLPTGNPAWQMLVDKSARTFEGVVGHKLRTIRLRGQISQGYVVPVAELPQISEWFLNNFGDASIDPRKQDFSEMLGIKKWEATLPACLAGHVEGAFPSFIRRTDQERCQNLKNEIFGFKDTTEPFEVHGIPAEAVQRMLEKGELIDYGNATYAKVHKAKGDPNAQYEVTLKLDGSSMTVFAHSQFGGPFKDEDGVWQNPIVGGVCSRNIHLKVNEANQGNSFVHVALKSGLFGALKDMAEDGQELAVQGELMGPGIQDNRENLHSFQLFIFDVQKIDPTGYGSTYFTPEERGRFMKDLYSRGVNPDMVKHVPIVAHRANLLDTLGITSVEGLLRFAEGPSISHAVREGLVFKKLDGTFSFKAISNKYLASEKD